MASDLTTLMRISRDDPSPSDSDYLLKFVGMAITGILICVILGGGLAAITEVIGSTISGLDPDFSNLEPFLRLLPLLFVILAVSWFAYRIGSNHLSGKW